MFYRNPLYPHMLAYRHHGCVIYIHLPEVPARNWPGWVWHVYGRQAYHQEPCRTEAENIRYLRWQGWHLV